MKINRPFSVDKKQPGIVRGGFYDAMGGMLVGVHAQWVCDALNAQLDREAEVVCIGCGCTHTDPCDPPCSWLDTDGARGICDAPACSRAAARFARGDRELSRRAKAAVKMREEMRA